MQLDFAQPKNLSQQARSGSTSVLTLPQFSFLLALLHPFRHRFRAAGGAEILRAANSAEMVDVKQKEKIVPLITCGIALCQYVCGVDIFDLNLWIQLNSQSSETLGVLDTCLITGKLPLMIILITASLSSKIHN